ncbi:unnamed protein product [Agarophyton chilense]
MVPPSMDVDVFTRIVVDRAAQDRSDKVPEMVKQYLFTDAREHVNRAVQDLWVSERFAESRPTQVNIAKRIPQGFQMGHSTHSKHSPTEIENRKGKKRRTKRGKNREDDSDPHSSDSSSDTSSSSDDDRKGKKKKKPNRSTKKSSKKTRKGKKRYNEWPDSESDTEMDLEVHQPLNDMFTKAVDYRTYRLINKSSEYTQEIAQNITKHHKKLSFQMGDTAFTAYYLLQGRLRGNTLAMDEDGTEMLESCPEVVNFLLETYATDEVIQEVYSEVLAYHQRSGQTESEFSLALWNLATRCGNVFPTSRLKSLFADNFDRAIRSQILNYLATNRKVDYNALARYSQGLGDTLWMGKRPNVPPTSKDKPKSSVLEIEDTTTSEGSSHLEVPTGTAIHLVATQERFSKPSKVENCCSTRTPNSVPSPPSVMSSQRMQGASSHNSPPTSYATAPTNQVSRPPSMVTRDPPTGGLVCWFCLATDHLANNCANLPPGMRDQLIQARIQNHQRLYGSSTQTTNRFQPRTPVQVNTIEETPNLDSTPPV